MSLLSMTSLLLLCFFFVFIANRDAYAAFLMHRKAHGAANAGMQHAFLEFFHCRLQVSADVGNAFPVASCVRPDHFVSWLWWLGICLRLGTPYLRPTCRDLSPPLRSHRGKATFTLFFH